MNDDSTTDSGRDTCSSYYDRFPGSCGNYDDDDFTASERCCACGGGLYGGSLAPTVTPKPTADPPSPKPTVAPTPRPTRAPVSFAADGGFIADNDSIRVAVRLWFSDRATAEAAYDHISTWETGGVTDMDELFYNVDDDDFYRGSSFNDDISAWDTSGVTTMNQMFRDAAAFNQDIGAWDTSGVTTMEDMFYFASSFNRYIGGWAVDNVKSMDNMFEGAFAFDQDLGWCVADDVDFHKTFDGHGHAAAHAAQELPARPSRSPPTFSAAAQRLSTRARRRTRAHRRPLYLEARRLRTRSRLRHPP